MSQMSGFIMYPICGHRFTFLLMYMYLILKLSSFYKHTRSVVGSQPGVNEEFMGKSTYFQNFAGANLQRE